MIRILAVLMGLAAAGLIGIALVTYRDGIVWRGDWIEAPDENGWAGA